MKHTNEDLKDALFECLLNDMKDPKKRKPDLYKVVREVLRDNRGDPSVLPLVDMTESSQPPFRIGGTG